MWRFALLVTLLACAIFVSRPERSEAGVAFCVLAVRDVDIDLFGFNYLYAALASCTGENFDKAHISVHLEYYDWQEERWRFIRDSASASEQDDNEIIAWGAESVGAFQGINCRGLTPCSPSRTVAEADFQQEDQWRVLLIDRPYT